MGRTAVAAGLVVAVVAAAASAVAGTVADWRERRRIVYQSPDHLLVVRRGEMCSLAAVAVVAVEEAGGWRLLTRRMHWVQLTLWQLERERGGEGGGRERQM